MKWMGKHGYFCCLQLLLMFLPLASFAAALGVSPTRLELAPNERISSLQLSNKDQQPVVVQVKVVKWTQKDGKDVYEKTGEVIVTPPVASIAAKDAQILRVGIVQPPNPSQENSYRVFIKEVPQRVDHSPGVHTILQLSLPIFVKPIKEVNSLQWSLQKTSSQHVVLKLVNNGNTHIHVSGFKFYPPGQPALTDSHSQTVQEKPFFTQQVFTYLFPNQATTWDLKLAQPIVGSSMKVVATTDRGDINVNVSVT